MNDETPLDDAQESASPDTASPPPRSKDKGFDLSPYVRLGESIIARMRQEEEDALPEFLKSPVKATAGTSKQAGTHDANSSTTPQTSRLAQSPRDIESAGSAQVLLEVHDFGSDKQLMAELRACVESLAKRCRELARDEVRQAFERYNAVRKAYFR